MGMWQSNLSEEIEDMFTDIEEMSEAIAVSRAYGGMAPGYAHVIHTTRDERGWKKTQKTAARNRAYASKADATDTARRILAGEIPQALISGKGRQPRRWLRVAESLGIDLQARAAAARAAQEVA